MSRPVLIVDDNKANLKLLSFIVRNEGLEYRTASTAEEALEVILECSPELILLDIQLPGMSGIELVRILRTRTETADLAIIAITANAMSGDREAMLEAGFTFYLSKPINTRQLPAVIRKYLSSEWRTPALLEVWPCLVTRKAMGWRGCERTTEGSAPEKPGNPSQFEYLFSHSYSRRLSSRKDDDKNDLTTLAQTALPSGRTSAVWLQRRTQEGSRDESRLTVIPHENTCFPD